MSASMIGASWASSAVLQAPPGSVTSTSARHVPSGPRASNSAWAPASRAARWPAPAEQMVGDRLRGERGRCGRPARGRRTAGARGRSSRTSCARTCRTSAASAAAPSTPRPTGARSRDPATARRRPPLRVHGPAPAGDAELVALRVGKDDRTRRHPAHVGPYRAEALGTGRPPSPGLLDGVGHHVEMDPVMNRPFAAQPHPGRGFGCWRAARARRCR